MPRIHSWREVIAPRDCWCVAHRNTPRRLLSSNIAGTSTAAWNPRRVPLGSHPSHPPRGTSNEQFHYCLTPVINLHGRPLALPPPLPPPGPRAHPTSPLPPTTTLSRLARSRSRSLSLSFTPLFHLSPPEDLLPRFHDFVSFLSLRLSYFLVGSISLHYVSSLLSSASSSFHLFHLIPRPPPPASNGEKTERTRRVLVSHFLRHCLKKNNDEKGASPFGEVASLRCSYAPYFLAWPSRSLASYNLRRVVTKFPTAPRSNSPE